MEILVCVKQVPDDSVEISLDPKTGAPALDGVTPVVNAFDTYALEMAVRLKEAAGGEVTVLSIGDESVKNSLKNCLAVGADYAYLAANDAYQSADPEIIAKELRLRRKPSRRRQERNLTSCSAAKRPQISLPDRWERSWRRSFPLR